VIVADTGNDVATRRGRSVTTVSSMDFSGSSSVWRPVVSPWVPGRLYVTDARAQVVELVPDGGRRYRRRLGFPRLGTAALLREPSGRGRRLRLVADTST
jgi:hypothetical protein